VPKIVANFHRTFTRIGNFDKSVRGSRGAVMLFGVSFGPSSGNIRDLHLDDETLKVATYTELVTPGHHELASHRWGHASHHTWSKAATDATKESNQFQKV
jgi:hypothetical protein